MDCVFSIQEGIENPWKVFSKEKGQILFSKMNSPAILHRMNWEKLIMGAAKPFKWLFEYSS